MKRIVFLLFLGVSVIFVTSCASFRPEYKCSDSPQNAVSTFLKGMAEFSISLLRAVIPKDASVFGVFGNGDEERGREVIKELVAHPEFLEEDKGCLCSLYQKIEDTLDPQEKIVVIKRVTFVGKEQDEKRDYKRSFLVRFDQRGNCITSITPTDKWERIN